MARGVVAKKEKLARLRGEHGWTQQDLAEKAGVSQRTIQSIEAGKACSRYTLNCIAESLGVKFIDLAKAEVATGNLEVPPGLKVELDIVLNESHKDYDQTKVLQLTAKLELDLMLMGVIVVKRIKEGSVTVAVEMLLTDALKVRRHLASLDFDGLGIKAIRFPEGVLWPRYDGRGNLLPEPATLEDIVIGADDE